MMLPGSATIPANDTRRLASAEASGRRAVELVRENLRPAQIMTRPAFENALRVFMTIGGSTNAVIHLLAIAGRLRVPLALDDFDQVARATPVLLNLLPAGARLMPDFDAAGGLPALMRQIDDLLHLDHVTVSGRPLGELLPRQRSADPAVIRPRDEPLRPSRRAGGAARQPGAARRDHSRGHRFGSAAAPSRPGAGVRQLRRHAGADRSPDLPVTADSVLVLRNAGAVGVPGLPEWGAIPVPKKLLLQGIQDIVRISDSRMSGTSFGTVVLHITPEAAIGGALALVHDGDMIELDVAARALTLCVTDAELERRRAAWAPTPAQHRRGYPRLYAEHVLQPDQGCDFDFLRPESDDDLPFVPPVVGRS